MRLPLTNLIHSIYSTYCNCYLQHIEENKSWFLSNIKKKKIISSENIEKVTMEAKFPFAVCRKGVGINSILCQFHVLGTSKI